MALKAGREGVNPSEVDLFGKLKALVWGRMQGSIADQADLKTALDSKMSYADNSILGAKNFIPYPYRDNESKEINGVTFTLNDDGSVTVQTVETGATADSNFSMRYRNDIPLPYIPIGNYYISGCPDGGSATKYYLDFNCTYSGGAKSYGRLMDSTPVLITRSPGETGLGCGITIKSGCIITTPITFKPMLRLASDTDDTYEPYAMTNRELTVNKLSTADLKAVAADSTDFADFQTKIAAL